MWKDMWKMEINSKNKPFAHISHLPPAVAELSAPCSPLHFPSSWLSLGMLQWHTSAFPLLVLKAKKHPTPRRKGSALSVVSHWQPCHSLSLNAFHHFLPFCPGCSSATSSTALINTIWPVASLKHLAEGWKEPPHGDTALECWLPFISCSGQQAALSLQTCSTDDITFHDFAVILRALCSMSSSTLSLHVRRCFTVFCLGTSPGPEPRHLNSKLLSGLMWMCTETARQKQRI